MGLLLLSSTNRLARPVDRIRQLNTVSAHQNEQDKNLVIKQIKILFLRCRLLKASIGLISLSIFFVCLIMFLLFCSYRFNIQLNFFIESFFMASLFLPIIGLLCSIADVWLTLHSLKFELKNTIGNL